jgi:hypothetical protein
MVVIRKDQEAELVKAKVKVFEDRVIAHVRQFFPEESGRLDEPELRETIRYGMGRAETYGLVSERDVCWYIDMMFAFGRDFDVDPDLPWAAEILNDKAAEPAVKTERLCAAAEEHEDQAKGLRKGQDA